MGHGRVWDPVSGEERVDVVWVGKTMKAGATALFEARHFKLGSFEAEAGGVSGDHEVGARRANLDGSEQTVEMRPRRGVFFFFAIVGEFSMPG